MKKNIKKYLIEAVIILCLFGTAYGAVVFRSAGISTGLSSDTKPTSAPLGARHTETDTGLKWEWTSFGWNTISAATRYIKDDLTFAAIDLSLYATKASPVFTGIATIADGTAAAPSLRFTSDADSGFYYNAKGFGYSVDGVSKLSQSSTGALSVVVPTYTYGLNLVGGRTMSLGVGSAYNNWVLSFWINTVYAMRIADNGGVHIGTAFTALGGSAAADPPANGLAVEGKIGGGVSVPTARLHLGAGTATASTAPLKFTSGTLLTAPEAGAIEFLTDAYYATITTGAARKTFAFLESPVFTGSTTSTQYKLSALNTAPANATEACTTGEIRIAADYFYLCSATNTWVRTQLSTW